MRVLLADEQSRVRSALRVLLEQNSDYEIVAEATEAAELVEKVQREAIELVVLDWRLPGLDGELLIETLQRTAQNLIIVVLSGRPEARQTALEAGADAFVSKADPPEELLATLHEVCTRRAH